jgi:hypothetical protein
MATRMGETFYVSVIGSLSGGHVACRTIRVPLQTLSAVMHVLRRQGLTLTVNSLSNTHGDDGGTHQPSSTKASLEALPSTEAEQSEPDRAKESKRGSRQSAKSASRSKRT